MAVSRDDRDRLFHEIRNALAVIIARCELIEMTAQETTAVGEIHDYAEKIANLIFHYEAEEERIANL